MKDVTELPWDSRQMLIAGRWRDASETLPLEDPSTGRVVGEIARGSAADIDAAVDAARAARPCVHTRDDTVCGRRGRRSANQHAHGMLMRYQT